MDAINDLKLASSQIDESKKSLDNLSNQRIIIENNLESSLKNALGNLRRQITNALIQKTLTQTNLALTTDEIEKLVDESEKNRLLEIKILDIKSSVTSLLRERRKILESNHDILADFGNEFWKISLEWDSKYEFNSDGLLVSFHNKKFSIPYLRFTEPREEVIEKIKPLVRKKEIQDRLKELNAENTLLESELNSLE